MEFIVSAPADAWLLDYFTASIMLHGVMGSPSFVRFLRQFHDQVKESLGTGESLVLDRLSREGPLADDLLSCTNGLIEQRIIVHAARGSFIVAEAYYRTRRNISMIARE